MAMSKKEFIKLFSQRMMVSEKEALEIVDAYNETLLDVFKTGNGVSLSGFGTYYLDRRRESTAFKFNPSQRLRKILGWGNTYKGEI